MIQVIFDQSKWEKKKKLLIQKLYIKGKSVFETILIRIIINLK